MTEPFLDANVILRHLLQDIPDQSSRATHLFTKIALAETAVMSADSVILEVVFTLQRTYRFSKALIRDRVSEILLLDGISIPGTQQLLDALAVFADLNISFNDAYHAALMNRMGITEVISFDHDFDRLPGITRVEP